MNSSLSRRVKVIMQSHVESEKGAVLHVERLELSLAGTALLTSTSKSIFGRPTIKTGVPPFASDFSKKSVF